MPAWTSKAGGIPPLYCHIMLGSSMKLAYAWSAGGHSWNPCLTISESISQRYYRDPSFCQIFFIPAYQWKEWCLGMANKVRVRSLNKAWNWQDVCKWRTAEPQAVLQHAGTAAHLQTAWLPFGLPSKCPPLWLNTFNAENDFIFHYKYHI